MYCFLNIRGFCAEIETIVNNFNLRPKSDLHNTNYYVGKIDNLRLCVKADGNYQIEGSIWKYALGNNYMRFDLVNFKDALQELNSLLVGTLSKARVIAFEFGLNIPTPSDPCLYLEQMDYYRVNNNRNYGLYHVYKSRGNKFWGVNSKGAHNGFKAYSKTEESRLDYNLLRLEYYIKNVRTIFTKDLFVSDLYHTSFINTLYSKLTTFVNNIGFKLDYDDTYLRNLSIHDKYRYLALQQISQQDLKSVLHLNPKTADREAKILKRIIDECGQKTIRLEFINSYNSAIDAVNPKSGGNLS